MKTRVIRYWHKTDWLYKVEKFIEATGEETWVSFGGEPRDGWKAPAKGEWFWSQVDGGLSRDRAMSIASRLALDLAQEDDDIVAEFGE